MHGLPWAYVASTMLSRHMQVKLIISMKRILTELTNRMSCKSTSLTFTTINHRVPRPHMLSQLCSII